MGRLKNIFLNTFGSVIRLSLCLMLFISCSVVLSSCKQNDTGESTLINLKSSDTINIGIKFDQPGLGYKNGSQFSGFDVDVAKYIANELGFSEDKIVFKEAPSKQRETLIQNGAVDLVVASYSITDTRKELVSFAGPYFVAGQDLLIRSNDKTITGPQSLNGKNLCSVTGSTSAKTIKDKYSTQVNLMEQPGYAECLQSLRTKMVDAVTTDDILLAGLAASSGSNDVKVVGKPFTVERYGIGIKKGDVEFAKVINLALTKMVDTHEFDKLILKNTKGTNFKYNQQYNPPKLDDLSIIESQKLQISKDSEFKKQFFGIPYLFQTYNIPNAFLVNLELTLFSGIFALLLGVILLIMRISPVSSLRIVASGWVEFFRNIPLTVVMVFMVLGVFSGLQIQISSDFDFNFFVFAVIGLGVYHSAFVCEALRSGVNTVPIGQAQAARAVGMSFAQSAKHIILPQSFRGSIAPLGNVLIALIKNTTVAAASSVATETSSIMSGAIEFDPQLIVQIFLIFALGYVVIIMPLGMLVTYLSDKLAVKR